MAEVIPVITLPSGALQIPDDPSRIGWWAAGAAPGQSTGTMVLAGHMDGLHHSGAMSALFHVKNGQMVIIEDRRGKSHPYRITARTTAPRTNLDPTLCSPPQAHTAWC